MNELTIKEFVQKTISEIEEAVPHDYEIDDSILFEVSVKTTVNTSGGVDIKIVSGKLSDEKEVIHKIEFSVSNIKRQEKKTQTMINNINSFLLSLKELSNKINPNDQSTGLIK